MMLRGRWLPLLLRRVGREIASDEQRQQNRDR